MNTDELFTERELRLIKDLNKMRKVLLLLLSQPVLHECINNGIEIASLYPGNEWWEKTEEETLRLWLAGDITEGRAAYNLGVDRITARSMAEKYAQEHGLEDKRWG